jgi:drug/metabolite transporter (DMT)-like permease
MLMDSMLWFVLSLLSAFLQSTSDLFSKKSLANLNNEYLVAFLRTFFVPFLLIPLLLFTGIPSLDSTFWITVLSNAGLVAATSILYMRALKLSPLSLVVPMLAFTPIFLLVLSPIMLGEFPGFFGLIGISFTILGAYTLSIKDMKKGYLVPFKTLFKEKGALIMLFVAFLFGISSSLMKIGAEHSSPLFFIIVSETIVLLLLFPVLLTPHKGSLKHGIRQNVKSIVALGVFYALMDVMFILALQSAMVSYVVSVRRTTIVFSTVYGHFFNEQHIQDRLIGALVMALGILFIAFS